MLRDDLLDWAKEHVGLFNLPLDRLSTCLLFQLHYLEASRTIDIFHVTDLIAQMEDIMPRGNTKPPELLIESPYLRGLYHAHFFDARFLARNLLQEIMRTDKREFGGKSINQLANDCIIGAYEKRASERRLTGEWLVYAKNPADRRNYYLTISSHPKQPYGDNQLALHILRSVVSEWPNLPYPTDLLGAKSDFQVDIPYPGSFMYPWTKTFVENAGINPFAVV